jgi:predicted esterase
MYRAFVEAIEKRCRNEGLPSSLFLYEEAEKGHEITNDMLNAALGFLKKYLRGPV